MRHYECNNVLTKYFHYFLTDLSKFAHLGNDHSSDFDIHWNGAPTAIGKLMYQLLSCY